MNGQDLRNWRMAKGLSQGAAAEVLAHGTRSIRNYEAAPEDPIPKSLVLAMGAESAGFTGNETLEEILDGAEPPEGRRRISPVYKKRGS